MEISTGDSAVRGLHRGPGPSVCPLRGTPPSAPSSETCRRVTGAAPAAPRAWAGAIGARKALRTDTGRSWRGFPRARSPAGTTGCPCSRSAPDPAARASRTRPAGLPEGGWRVPRRLAHSCGEIRASIPKKPRCCPRPRHLPTAAPRVSAGGCRRPRRAGPLTSRWCCGRPIPGAAEPRRTAPGPAQPSRRQRHRGPASRMAWATREPGRATAAEGAGTGELRVPEVSDCLWEFGARPGSGC